MELLYMVGWDIKRGSLCGKQYSKVMYDPAIPYHIYPYIPKKLKIDTPKNTCIQIIATLFTTSRR